MWRRIAPAGWEDPTPPMSRERRQAEVDARFWEEMVRLVRPGCLERAQRELRAARRRLEEIRAREAETPPERGH